MAPRLAPKGGANLGHQAIEWVPRTSSSRVSVLGSQFLVLMGHRMAEVGERLFQVPESAAEGLDLG